MQREQLLPARRNVACDRAMERESFDGQSSLRGNPKRRHGNNGRENSGGEKRPFHEGSVPRLWRHGLERWKPQHPTRRPPLLLAIRDLGSIPSRRAAGHSHEGSREVRMVGESGVKGDVRNGSPLTSELFACPRDTPPPQVLTHRAAKPPTEQFG